MTGEISGDGDVRSGCASCGAADLKRERSPLELPAEPAVPGEPRLEATRLPALARYWWLTAVRGLVALTLALAVVVAGRGTSRLVTFLGLY